MNSSHILHKMNARWGDHKCPSVHIFSLHNYEYVTTEQISMKLCTGLHKKLACIPNFSSC
jgi:hypothetical protein